MNGYLLQKSGSSLDKIGTFVVDTLKKGEYCFGYYDYTTGISSIDVGANSLLSVFPNPSRDTFTILVDDPSVRSYLLKIADTNGKIVYEGTLNGGSKFTWKPKNNSAEIFFVSIYDHSKLIETKKITFIR